MRLQHRGCSLDVVSSTLQRGPSCVPKLARDPCGPSSAQPLVFVRRVLWVDEVLPVECIGGKANHAGGSMDSSVAEAGLAPPCNVDWQNFVHAATLRARWPTLIRGCGVVPTPMHRLRDGCTGSRRYWQNLFHQPSRPIVSSCRDQVSRGGRRTSSRMLDAAASKLHPGGCSLVAAAFRLQP